MSVPKKHQKSFYDAQARVATLLKPYLGRCVGQYFAANGTLAIETFLVCSKEADAEHPDGNRHLWRGIVTVYYGFGVAREDTHVQFSYAEELVQAALGMPNTGKWEDTADVLAKLVPALPVAPVEG